MGSKQNIMTTQAIEQVPTRSSGEIEQDIRERRDKMDQTLDELGNRLNLRSMVDTALEWWDEPRSGNQAGAATRRAFKGLACQIKQHPMPSLLIGGSVAWLIADASDHENDPTPISPDHPERETGASTLSAVGGSVNHAKETISGVMANSKEKVSEYSGAASEMSHRALRRGKSTVRKMGHEIAHGYERGTESFTRAVESYPLGVGLAFAALGALVGLAFPHTTKEDELMGLKSEELLDTAKEKGGQLLETGIELSGRVLESVKEEAREQGFTGHGLAETLSDIADKGAKVAQKANAEVTQAVQEFRNDSASHPPSP